MKLRLAAQKDVPTLLDIYGHYISSEITFEYVLPTLEEFSQRVSSISAYYPYLVLEEEGKVLGYAYAHPIAERAAYAWGAELSIYLSPDVTGLGLGKRLYVALIELLRLQGVRTVYGLVASPNPASEALHKSLGFEVMGIQHRAGYKNGCWIDLLWFEKGIAFYDPEPAPLIPFPHLPEQQVQRLLNHF